jgi:NAD(P)-dependent dehydrogenase (short-subunit alcohol dehydrogenase family)
LIKGLMSRVAVVTGASKGLGAEIVRALHRYGWLVVMLSRSGSDTLAKECGALDLRGDATLETDVRSAVDRAVQWGKLELFVANAGVCGPPGPTWKVQSWWEGRRENFFPLVRC